MYTGDSLASSLLSSSTCQPGQMASSTDHSPPSSATDQWTSPLPATLRSFTVFAPQFDGVYCLEAALPSSASAITSSSSCSSDSPAKSAAPSLKSESSSRGRTNWWPSSSLRVSSSSAAVFAAPEFDGLNCYETMIPAWRR